MYRQVQLYRLDGVEVRLQQTSEAFEKSRDAAKKSKMEYEKVKKMRYNRRSLSQRGDSPFVYRDGTGWPASLPYIRNIHVSVAIGTQSGIRLHERVPMVKIWGSSKNDQNWTTGKLLKL